ncbi:MAG: glycosyltransferase [Comamonadaceae bacterium]|nr:glycosyltransferase [Comamonadaceae bacterium]
MQSTTPPTAAAPAPLPPAALVQQLLLPQDTALSDLYLRYLAGYSEVIDDALHMERGAKVSFNSYFNSFYESYWSQISSVHELELEIAFTGSLQLEVFRDTRDYGCQKIAFTRLKSDGSQPQRVALNALASTTGELSGRIFLDLGARRRSRIDSIGFVTRSAPQRQPRLSIGICTFNREKFLLRNLRALLALPQLRDALARIVVVNQGPPFALPELAKLTQSEPRILLIEQGNLGGCGGFTRTMHEALQLEGITHHVLMDDDAVIDARVLHTLHSLLQFIGPDYAVGGHMLDMMRPHFLYEAGARVRANTRIQSLHHNIDLRSLDALIPFNRYHEVDYNAWWFCAIPTAHIEAAQLPAPIFIRGDDMEYGLRLQQRGVKTVAMPGIAVWHEPFYVKVGSWQTYYDLRNRLVLASTYPDRFRHESPIDVLWWMLKAAASHDYLSATLLARAVRDFLQGPDVLDSGADAIHADIAALAKQLAPAPADQYQLPPRPAKLRRMPRSDFGLALLVLYRLAMALLLARSSGAKLLLDHEANLSNIGPRPYVKTNGLGSYHLRYSPDRTLLRQTLRQAWGAWSAYRRQRHAAAQAWAQRIPQLRSRQAWQDIFAHDAQRRRAAAQEQ